jgi:PKD repeat protein
MPHSRSLASRLAVLAAAAVALLLAAGAEAATATVTITNTKFTDAVSGNSTTTINVGDSVTWSWGGGEHSTTSGSCSGACNPNGGWNSGIRTSGTFSQAFPVAGTFTYFCMVHLSMMQGTVIVQTGGPGPTANFTFSPAGPVIGNPVTFTDSSTGSPTAWLWNFGDPASGTSNTSTAQNPTHTFLAAGDYTVSLQATNAGGSTTSTKTVTASNGGPIVCDPNDTESLCLNGGRFQVTAEWDSGTDSGHGTGVKLTADSGYFWFFDANNIEVVTKVLNGCAISNSYWVFAAGLTNVQVELRVVDTTTGAVYLNENPQGTAFVPIQNTGAFPASCP